MADAEKEMALKLIDDESGDELEFEHLLAFEYDGEFYVAFTPKRPTEGYNMGQVYFMHKVGEDGDDEIYWTVDPEGEAETLDKIWHVFEELYYESEDPV